MTMAGLNRLSNASFFALAFIFVANKAHLDPGGYAHSDLMQMFRQLFQ